DKAVQVPNELLGDMTVATAEANPGWKKAKETSDFKLFLGPLERNVELRRRYIECFEPQDEPYDILLDDFEPEMKSADVARIFKEINDELVPLNANLHDADPDDAVLPGH